jgi:hypothetical protein
VVPVFGSMHSHFTCNVSHSQTKRAAEHATL